ncbi:hypothetical protein OGAPHI_006710 [Ogataea philodendri]|uniref:Uncharacterized protein n=1 Tax=Ogataea philodendri TaxID=1378263 RepID=A0A9P8NWS5_9ASCO|nr:uncharacterized protein OGAPHI_006710 [Ogataea philodendri]KAH3661303.1 hypothetical protein OGAPHI_006710 [Ogataea philodendri]
MSTIMLQRIELLENLAVLGLWLQRTVANGQSHGRPFSDRLALRVASRKVSVHSQNVLTDLSVFIVGNLVRHHEQQVETRKKRVRKSNVLLWGLEGIILAVDRVGSCNHRTSCVQRRVDSGLGNGDGLLLHDFVDSNTVDVAHLVELVDTNDTSIRKNHRTGLQPSFSRLLVAGNCGSQTDTRRTTSGGGNSQSSSVQNKPKNLRLGSGRISHHQQVDVSTKMCSVGQVFLCSSKKHQQHCFFDVVMAVNRWSKRLRQNVKYIFFLGQLIDVSDIEICDFLHRLHRRRPSMQRIQRVTQDDHFESRAVVLASSQRPENTDDLYSITRLDLVDQVVVQNHVHGPRKLSRWSKLRQFLDSNGLVVSVLGITVLCDQLVPVRVLGGVIRRGGDRIETGSLVSIFTSVKFFGRVTVMNRLDDLWTDQRRPCDDSFNGNHLGKERRVDRPRRQLMRPKGSTESQIKVGILSDVHLRILVRVEKC